MTVKQKYDLVIELVKKGKSNAFILETIESLEEPLITPLENIIISSLKEKTLFNEGWDFYTAEELINKLGMKDKISSRIMGKILIKLKVKFRISNGYKKYKIQIK